MGIHNGHDNDGVYAMKHEYSKLSMPETVYPGLLGGVIAPMATNGSTVFVPVVNHPVTFTTQTETQENGPSTGEVVALDAATGAVKWTHKFSGRRVRRDDGGQRRRVRDDVRRGAVRVRRQHGSVVWETKLPAATNTGVAVSGDTLIAPAGLAAGERTDAGDRRLSYCAGGHRRRRHLKAAAKR